MKQSFFIAYDRAVTSSLPKPFHHSIEQAIGLPSYDKNDIGAAILTGDEAIEASTLANPYYADALCRAYNDYMIDYWLPKDERFWGSIVVAPQDPQLAAAEIRRLGHHPRMVQVLVSHGANRPYGDPFYHPIYEACAEVGLPFAMHLGGQGGINSTPIGAGPTTYFWETHAILPQTAMTHMASFIAQGVFEKSLDAPCLLRCAFLCYSDCIAVSYQQFC